MKNHIINALGRTRGRSVIKSLGLNISAGSKADMTYGYQQAAEWQTEGICGIAQEKEKNCFSREWTMLIIWCCANSWPWISLGWKFWKKRSKPSEATSGTTFQLQALRRSCSFFQDGDTFEKSSKRCWLVCFPVPNFFSYTCCPWSFLQFCDLSLNFQ